MSNKTQLQTNNAELSALIQTLQGKAGGSGASVETCTVTITKPSAWGLHYIDYTGLVDGVITPASQNFSGTITSISVEAVAGSMLTITNTAPSSQEYYANTVCTNCELIRLTTDDLSLMSVAMMIGLPTSGTATIAING